MNVVSPMMHLDPGPGAWRIKGISGGGFGAISTVAAEPCNCRRLCCRRYHGTGRTSRVAEIGLGCATGATRDVEEVLLAPGNRADLLVTAAAGAAGLHTLPVDRGSMGSMMGGSNAGAKPQPGTDGAVMAAFSVTGEPAAAPEAVPAQPVPGTCALRRFRSPGELVPVVQEDDDDDEVAVRAVVHQLSST
jgi:hypothetical protein